MTAPANAAPLQNTQELSPDNDTFHIVDYTPAYTDAIVSLFTLGMEDNITDELHPPSSAALARFINYAAPNLRDIPTFVNEARGGRFFLALSSTNELVGILALKQAEEDAEHKTAELTRISVARQWRRKGVCRALIAHAIREAVENFKVLTVYLSTMSTMKASSYYERLGFVVQSKDNREWGTILKFVLNVEEKDWWRNWGQSN